MMYMYHVYTCTCMYISCHMSFTLFHTLNMTQTTLQHVQCNHHDNGNMLTGLLKKIPEKILVCNVTHVKLYIRILSISSCSLQAVDVGPV